MGNRDIWDELELTGRGEHLDEEMFEFLSAYVDGECSAKERRLVEAYLTESSAASALLAELRTQAAFVSEESVEPPNWLTESILSKTVGKRKARWPFAAGLAATCAAAAIAAVATLPRGVDDSRRNDVFASAVNEGPVFSAPAPDTNRIGSAELPPLQPAAKAKSRVLDTPRRLAEFRTVASPARTESTGVSKVEVVESAPAPSGPPVIEPDVTYAVVEYGSGRFQPKQPDMVDGSQSLEQSPPSGEKPTVLPDARERLRDQVRKVNEKKLDIEDKERTG